MSKQVNKRSGGRSHSSILDLLGIDLQLPEIKIQPCRGMNKTIQDKLTRYFTLNPTHNGKLNRLELTKLLCINNDTYG